MSEPQGFEPATRAEELFAAFLEAEETGQAPDFESYCAEHPQEAAQLRRLWGADAWLRPLYGPLPGERQPGEQETEVQVPERLRAALEALSRRDSPYQRYEERAALAEKGGQGRLLVLWDHDLQRPVVQKSLRLPASGRQGDESFDPQAAGRLLDEARITGRLEHPGIVPVHEIGLTTEGELYFTMKQVAGRDLDEVFADYEAGESEDSRARVLGMIMRACEAVAYAHDRGVAHRDLKPENIRVGDFGQVYVIDWGVARVVGGSELLPTPGGAGVQDEEDPRWTLDGYTPGTRGYLAPERSVPGGDQDERRADVYGMGAVLYRWLSGRLPYHEPGQRLDLDEYLRLLRAGPPTPVQELRRDAPAPLAAICERAMAHEPAARYPDMRALAADLEAFVEQRTVRAYRTGAAAELGMWVRRNKGLTASAFMATVLLVSLLAWKLVGDMATLRRTRWLQYTTAISTADADVDRGRPFNALRILQKTEPSLREWEAFHIAMRARSLEAVFGVHGGGVRQAAFSPDGSWAASVSDDKALRIWSPETGAELVPAIVHDDLVRCMAIDPSGRWIATATYGGLLQVFSSSDGALHPGFGRVQTPPMATEGVAVTRLAFHPGGEVLASVARDARLRLWKLADGAALRTAHVTRGAVYGLAFSADGKRVATCGQDKDSPLQPFVKVWDYDSLREHDRLEELQRFPMSTKAFGLTLAFSAEGKYLAAGSLAAHVWNLETEELTLLEGHEQFVFSLDFSPDSALLVTGSLDRSCRVWNLSAGKEIASHGHDDQVRSVAFHSRESVVLSASMDGSARLWPIDPTPGRRLLASNEKTKGTVAFSPDGRRVAVGDDDSILRLWSHPQGELLGEYQHHGDRLDDLVWIDDERLVSLSPDDDVRLWTIADPPESVVIGQFEQDPAQLALSRDRDTLVAVSHDGSLLEWDTATLEMRRREPGLGSLTAVALDEPGSLLALGTKAGQVHLLTMDDLEPHATFGTHVDPTDAAPENVTRLLFLPGGDLLSTGEGGTLLVHDRGSGESRTLHQTGQALTSLASLGGGRRFAVSGWDGAVSIWDSEHLELLLDLRGQPFGINQIAVSPDGRDLAAASNDGQVLLLTSRATID